MGIGARRCRSTGFARSYMIRPTGDEQVRRRHERTVRRSDTGNGGGLMIRGRRRAIVAGLVLAGWAFGQATVGVPQSSAAGTPVAVTPTVTGAASAATGANNAAKVATPTVAVPATTAAPPAVPAGSDAPFMRFGLILMLGLALGSGAVVQYRATADAPPYRPKPRRPRRKAPLFGAAAPSATAATAAPDPAPTKQVAEPAPIIPVAPLPSGPSAPRTAERVPVFSAFPRREQSGAASTPQTRPQPLRVVESATRQTHAEGCCAHAIAAAYRYDRPATLAAFGAALDADPILKPSALPDFWEMPAGGHADLAVAYLQREQRLDARSVVTLALLTFPHNRELSALLREIDPYRLDRPA